VSILAAIAAQDVDNDLRGYVQLAFILLLVAGPALAKIVKRKLEGSAPPADPRARPPLDPPEREPQVSWRDLLEGRLPQREVPRVPVPAKPVPSQSEPRPRQVLAELPDEDELEATGEDAASLEEDGAAPPLEVLAQRETATADSLSLTAVPMTVDGFRTGNRAGRRLLGRLAETADWRRGMIMSEVLGAPLGWREARIGPFP